MAAEEYSLFLVKESERELMLAEEAKKQLTKKSEEADRAREAKAEKDWPELQEKESAECVPVGAPVFRYRSIQAGRSREMLESMGNLRDRWSEAPLERCNWFDSDLCILEPINSMQLAAFKQLKLTGLLCSRSSATVRKGGDSSPWQEKTQSCQMVGEIRGERRHGGSSSCQPALQHPSRMGGSRVEGGVPEDPLAVPGLSGLDVKAMGDSSSGLAAVVVPAAPVAEPVGAVE